MFFFLYLMHVSFQNVENIKTVYVYSVHTIMKSDSLRLEKEPVE